MKDKLLTKQELKKAEEIFSSFGTKFILNWTQAELKKYRSKPVVIPAGNYGFFVGNFIIKGETKDSWKVEQFDNKLIHRFMSKQNAILYCLLDTTQRYNLANELLQLDEKLGNLHNNIVLYEQNMRRTKDKLKHAVLLSRYVDVKTQYKFYNKFLKKTLNSAKYLKFGNTPL